MGNMRKSLIFLLLILLIALSTAYAEEPLIYYHGSSANFEKVEPRHSTRIGVDRVLWDGDAIFATPDFRIALFYTHTRMSDCYGGVDLITLIDQDTPLSFTVYGGKNVDEALDRLFGIKGEPSSKGYIYLLDSSYFQWMDGLGEMERITTDVDANIGKMEVDRRELIDRYVKSGKIEIQWVGLFIGSDIVLNQDE